MTTPLFKFVLLLALSVLLSSCGVITCSVCAERNQHHAGDSAGGDYSDGISGSAEQVHAKDPVIISVTGFGALDTGNNNKPQQLLMAMRASEVDAYRALAERVKGLQVSGSTKVVDFVTEYDHLRALVDSYIKNAKILSQGITADGYYETTLSLTLTQEFFKTFTQTTRELQTVTTEQPAKQNADMQVNPGFAVPPSSTLSTTDSHYDIGFAPKAE